MYAALRERKLAKAWFVTECTPLFARLEGLCGQRSEILKDVHGVGNRQLTIWAALMPDYVPTLQVQSQLEAHNRAEDLIRMSRELQTQVMNELSVRNTVLTFSSRYSQDIDLGLAFSGNKYASYTPRAWRR